jgi:hypothetical protein
MPADLTTTNVFLGIMAAVSVLQVVSIVAAAAAGFTISRRMLRVVEGLEERQVAPAFARVNAILDDVKDVTSTVRKETGHIERLVEWIVEALSRRRQRAPQEPQDRVM